MQSLKLQASRAQTIEAARSKARQARQTIDQIRGLGYNGEDLDQMQADVEKILTEIARYEDQLEQARSVLDANRSWPISAARLSADLRARYPNDPGVIELNRSLGPYNNAILGIKIAAGALVIALIFLVIWLGVNQVRAYIISLTPTATATATPTATATRTPAPTPTYTSHSSAYRNAHGHPHPVHCHRRTENLGTQRLLRGIYGHRSNTGGWSGAAAASRTPLRYPVS